MHDKIVLSRKMSLKFPVETLIYVFLLLIYFKPADYVIGELIFKGFSLLLIIAGVFISAFCFFQVITRIITNSKRYYCPSLPVIILLCLYIWNLMGSSVINLKHGNDMQTSGVIIAGFSAIAFILMTDYGLFHNPKRYIKCFVGVGAFMCFLNNMTMILLKNSGGFQSGQISERGFGFDTSNYYLLAEDNATFFWSWPVFVAFWLYYYLYDRSRKVKVLAIIYSVTTVIAYLYVWSVLAMLCFMVTAFAIIFYSHRLNRDKNKKNIIAFVPSKMNILFVISMIFNYEMAVNLVFKKYSALIEKYLHKSPTLNGRLDIWEKALKHIKKAPIIGYGYEPNEVSVVKLGINHTHNILLETLYRGGIIGLLLFAAFFIIMGLKGKKVQSTSLYSFLIICMTLFLFSTAFEFAYYRYPHIFIFIILCHPELFRKDAFSVEQILQKK